MCGIAGFVGAGSESDLTTMLAGVRHRGPDDSGIFLKDNVGLAHARLSIIDTSAAGHQPMMNADGSVAIVFNGEIYNFLPLREELVKQGRIFTGHSDTEVILHLYDVYGERCFEKMDGMFALAIFDIRKQILLMARDRMGEKPLYWSLQNGTLLFASELGALMSCRLLKKEIDLVSLNKYVLFDYVPTPHTILKDVYKLEPGAVMTYENGVVRQRFFWTPPPALMSKKEPRILERFDALMHQSVASQLVSDVPLGVFLSGGIDSSTVAWYAQQHSSRPINTFSIAFEDAEFDESMYAREVAVRLGTTHHERTVTAADALALVKSIPDVFSEPVADASVIPTLLLSQFTRETVTVSLGGDGGDELCAGYPTFFAEKVWSVYHRLPSWIKKCVERCLGLLSSGDGNLGFIFKIKKFLSSDATVAGHRHVEWLGSFVKRDRDQLFSPAVRAVVDRQNVFEDIDAVTKQYTQPDAGNRLLYSYARSYLMDQVLVKVDRASMHHALEVRAPLLHRPLVEFVFSLPYSLKYRFFTTKYILKKLMRGRLPDHILDRKKRGFGIPVARWLKGELRPLCDTLLAPERLAAHGLFQADYVTKLKADHMSGRADNRKQLWNLMVFQMWYERWMK